jgi:hypothetical protein
MYVATSSISIVPVPIMDSEMINKLMNELSRKKT